MNAKKLGGVKSAAESLKGLDREEQVRILAKIALEDAKLAEEIKKHMFQFEDIIGLQAEDFRKVQQIIEPKKFYMALRNVSDDFIKDLEKLMSKRAYQMLLDEIDNLGPQKLSEVKECQKKIIDLVHEKANSGEISLPNKWSKDEYVA